jgi:hypothetical protein
MLGFAPIDRLLLLSQWVEPVSQARLYGTRGFENFMDLFWESTNEVERVSSKAFNNLVKYGLLWIVGNKVPDQSHLRNLMKTCDCGSDLCEHSIIGSTTKVIDLMDLSRNEEECDLGDMKSQGLKDTYGDNEEVYNSKQFGGDRVIYDCDKDGDDYELDGGNVDGVGDEVDDGNEVDAGNEDAEGNEVDDGNVDGVISEDDENYGQLESLYLRPNEVRIVELAIGGGNRGFKAFHYPVGNSIQQQEFNSRKNPALARFLFKENLGIEDEQLTRPLFRYERIAAAVLATECVESRTMCRVSISQQIHSFSFDILDRNILQMLHKVPRRGH